MVDERRPRIAARGPIARRHVLAARPRPVPPSVWMLPDPETADDDGVVGVGADLTPSTLVDAYRRGLFPWPHPGVPLPWFSPDPRGVLPLDGVHVSRSLRQRLRSCGWTTTVDRDFEAVLAGCAHRPDADGTWINDHMQLAYTRLHQLGWAHSLEVWQGRRLVGGIYGVQIGGAFTGESMFHRATDGSKVALVDLAQRLREAGGRLFDVQLTTDHLRSLGALDVPRSRFLAALDAAVELDVRLPIDERPVSRLAAAAPPRPEADGKD
jgi:leucyl/phenylalanyl-tRNA---protein transferase